MLYLDFGNDGWVASTAVYPLPWQLFSLPAQAVPCRLAGVVPVGGGGVEGVWLQEASQTLAPLLEKEVCATVKVRG